MLEREEPVWSRLWFQRLLAVLLCAAVAMLVLPPILALIYAVRPVLLPVLVGVALAYAVNPFARWAEAQYRVPRPVSAVLLMLGVTAAMLGIAAYVLPKLIMQVYQLITDIPGHVIRLGERLGVDMRDLAHRVEQHVREQLGMNQTADGNAATAAANIDFPQVAGAVLNWLGAGIGVIGSTVGYVTYLLVALVIIVFVFFFFLWKYDRVMAWFVPFIPAEHRTRTLEITRKMDRSVSGFIRGRLIQAAVVAVLLSVGWWAVGVPYWLLLGLAGGVLNLIPFAVVIVWPIAMLLAWLNSQGVAEGAEVVGISFDVVWVVVMPTVVYVVTQALDSWVVEPIVQGQATNLDPLTVLLAVMVGGSVAGLLGMLIAIPVAACGKILAQEVLLPRMRAMAAENEAKARAKGAVKVSGVKGR